MLRDAQHSHTAINCLSVVAILAACYLLVDAELLHSPAPWLGWTGGMMRNIRSSAAPPPPSHPIPTRCSQAQIRCMHDIQCMSGAWERRALASPPTGRHYTFITGDPEVRWKAWPCAAGAEKETLDRLIQTIFGLEVDSHSFSSCNSKDTVAAFTAYPF